MISITILLMLTIFYNMTFMILYNRAQKLKNSSCKYYIVHVCKTNFDNNK